MIPRRGDRAVLLTSPPSPLGWPRVGGSSSDPAERPRAGCDCGSGSAARAYASPRRRPFAPAHVDIAGDGSRSGAEIADVERCASCHAEAVRTWRGSAHALASFNNPLYRFSVDGFKRENGHVESRFCGGCHDPALLVDGAMDAEVAADDARARAGITCSVCHTAVDVRPGGAKAAYTLAAEPLMLRTCNDPTSIAEHRRRRRSQPHQDGRAVRQLSQGVSGRAHRTPLILRGQDADPALEAERVRGQPRRAVDEPVEQRTATAVTAARGGRSSPTRR